MVIDDEPLALDLIREYISKIPKLNLLTSFDDAIAGEAFLQKNSTDLLFVDINMPDITGLDLVRSLAERPMIIFTTAYGKFAVEGFELDAVDYLLKPISFERFSRAVDKAIEYAKYKRSTKDDRIAQVNAKSAMTLMPLKKVLEKLPAGRFERIHRSYIVAVDKIKSIQGRKVRLDSLVELPVSDSYADFLKRWKKN
ncbi:MAG TPA: DNA-binding response regulator [Chitinophagaceae bacterium]|nr:DNA-binding response regulator [Chitinophagaceae bacterium]